MRTFGFAGMLALLLIPAGNSFAYTGGPAQKLVYDFRDTMYLNEVSDDELAGLYSTLLISLDELSDKYELDTYELCFWKAEAAYYMARGYQFADSVEDVIVLDDYIRKGQFKKLQKSYKHLDDMIALYEESMDLAALSMEYERSARSVRIYAESLSQLSTLKSLGFLMHNGPKVKPLAEEALELDSNEIKAQMLLASRYVYSPAIWGGNPDKGIKMLSKIASAAENNKEDRHNVAVGIGYAHTMAGRWNEAAESFRKALEVYPSNIYALGMLKLCETKSN